jgi:hypothetical protein
MAEVVGGVLGSECGECFVKGLLKRGDRAGFESPQLLFHLCPALFNGIEIGRIGRQIAESGASLFDEFAYTVHLVGAQIIHDHQLAGFQLRTKDMSEISQEDIAIGGRLNRHSGYPSGNTDGSQQCQGPPATGRNSLLDACAMQRAAVAPGHFRRDTAFVDEDDLRRVDVPGFLPPELALRFDALAVLLGSME